MNGGYARCLEGQCLMMSFTNRIEELTSKNVALQKELLDYEQKEGRLVEQLRHENAVLKSKLDEAVKTLESSWKWIHFCDKKPNQLGVERAYAERDIEEALDKTRETR